MDIAEALNEAGETAGRGDRRSQWGPWAPKLLAYLAIWCFERRYRKQNTIARLKPNILAPPSFGAPKNFGLGWLWTSQKRDGPNETSLN